MNGITDGAGMSRFNRFGPAPVKHERIAQTAEPAPGFQRRSVACCLYKLNNSGVAPNWGGMLIWQIRRSFAVPKRNCRPFASLRAADVILSARLASGADLGGTLPMLAPALRQLEPL